jgi:hypothetical protein
MSDFILSERVTRGKKIGETTSYNMYLEEDVELFVKILKEQLGISPFDDNKFSISVNKTNSILRKLVGDRLI